MNAVSSQVSQQQPSDNGHVPHTVAAGWGVGSLATSTMLGAPSAALLFFLVTLVKLDPAVVGALIFGGKIVDVLTDPPIGALSDRTRSRYGRRRPWLLGSSFACGIAFALLFNVPELSTTGMYLYVAFALALFAITYTGFQVPYMAMPVEMTDDYHQRTKVMSWRVFFMSLGNVAGGGGFAAAAKMIGGEEAGRGDYGMAGIYFGIAITIFMLVAFFGTARARRTERVEGGDDISVRQHIEWLLINRPLMILIGTKIAIFLGLFSSLAAALFFFKSVLKLDENAFLAVILMQTIVTILFLPVWNWWSRRIGKKTAFLISLAGFGLTVLSWLLAQPGESITLLIVRGVLLGAFVAGAHLFAQSMLIDTFALDYGVTGQRREGVLSAAFSFIEKTCMALAPLIVGVLLSALGFDANLNPEDDQSESAVLAIQIGFIWIPVLCQVACMILLKFYRLTEADLQEATSA